MRLTPLVHEISWAVVERWQGLIASACTCSGSGARVGFARKEKPAGKEQGIYLTVAGYSPFGQSKPPYDRSAAIGPLPDPQVICSGNAALP